MEISQLFNTLKIFSQQHASGCGEDKTQKGQITIIITKRSFFTLAM